MTISIGSKFSSATGDYVVVSATRRGHTVQAQYGPDETSDRPGSAGFTVVIDDYR